MFNTISKCIIAYTIDDPFIFYSIYAYLFLNCKSLPKGIIPSMVPGLRISPAGMIKV